MITPILMPIFLRSESPKCPKCGKDEDVKQVCKHCGHEYEDDEPSLKAMFFIVFGILWVATTIIAWITDNATSHYPERDSYSLIEIIVIQFDFIINLAKNII